MSREHRAHPREHLEAVEGIDLLQDDSGCALQHPKLHRHRAPDGEFVKIGGSHSLEMVLSGEAVSEDEDIEAEGVFSGFVTSEVVVRLKSVQDPKERGLIEAEMCLYIGEGQTGLALEEIQNLKAFNNSSGNVFRLIRLL